jgi:hypothetical protein
MRPPVKTIDINKFHEMIGHCGFDDLNKAATIHSLRLKGGLKVCEDCPVDKARQRMLLKTGRKGVKHLVKEFI